jgi:hypothetical protein
MSIKSKKSFFLFLLGVFLLAAVNAGAAFAVPQTINYQGYLTDPDGTPLDVNVDMTFSIYDAAEGGVALWSESYTGVTVTEGIFNVVLGETSPFSPADFDSDRYLGVQVGSDAEMAPRQKFTSVAYAIASEYATSVGDGTVTTASLSDTAVTSGKIADDAVVEAKIAAGAITTDKVGLDAITGDKIADGSITASDISDGSGSGLNADLLDGLHASAFMTAGTDNWVNTTGDAITGDLSVSGKIGIGTASPEKTLHVVGDTKLVGTSGNDANAIELLVGQSSSGKAGKIYIRAGDAPDVYSANHWGGDVVIKGGMGYNNSGGDLKIEGGTSSVWTQSSTPTKVDIYGGDLDGFYASSALITVEGGKQLSPGGSNRNGGHILLAPGTAEGAGVSGNVGVGTTSPASKLEVAGVVHSTTGGFKFPDNSVQTSAVSVDGHSLDASDGSPTDALYVDDAGKVGIGTATPTAQLDIEGSTGYNQLRIRTPYTPTGTADTNGNTGDIGWDDNYLYVKTSAGWKRAALSTW